MKNGAEDPIDQAIAAAEQPTVKMTQLPVTISSTNRPAAVILPADATDAEIAEVAGWLLTKVLAAFREQRAKTAGGRIILP